MAKTTISINNASRPAPRWFRKIRKALEYLIDAAIVILMATGHTENSVLILILRVGMNAVFNALETVLANGEEYAPVQEQHP